MGIQTKEASVASFALLLTLATVPGSIVSFKLDPVLAQSASDVPTSTAPNGKTVRIDGSSSMKVTNEIRKQQLQQRSPGTNVEINYNGTNAALQSVVDGKTDLAAVGRPLTAQEKKGLVVAPQKRRKIAIVVGPENPFTGNLTFDQFAKIFRGEITNWSQVGGPPGPITLIDRPQTDDTRQALGTYAVFKQAPFVAAAGAVKLSDDSTDAVIKKLGTRGISYVIADQVTNTPGVRIVPMHKTLPSDPRYPFSQPQAYVYKGLTPVPVVAAFLGDASAPIAASPQASPASPQAAPAPVPAPAENKGFPWWLLLIPLIGGLLWWLLRRRPAPAVEAVAVPKVVPVAPVAPVVPVPPVAPVVPVAPVAPVILDEQQPDITLYGERLVAEKTRQKVGDVALGKRVETEQAQVSIPIEKDRVVIERTTPTETGSVVPGDVAFGAGEARIETYEETPQIRKEAFVREEVSVRKEVDQETVSAEETLRREELDISTKGHPAVDEENYPPRPNNSSR